MNPHPPLSGIPISIVLLITLLEIKTAVIKSEKDSAIRDFLIGSLAIFVPLTYYSGFWGAEVASITFKVAQEDVAYHQLYAKGLLISAIVLVGTHLLNRAYQKQVLRYVYLTVLLLTVGLTVYASHLGGQLVFESGAGVSAKDAASVPGIPEPVQ